MKNEFSEDYDYEKDYSEFAFLGIMFVGLISIYLIIEFSSAVIEYFWK